MSAIVCRGPRPATTVLFAVLLVAACGDVASACVSRTLLQTDQLQINNTLLLANINIPAAINAVPSGNTLHLAFRAVGHQHYIFNGTHWPLHNATAKLYSGSSTTSDDDVLGRHFFLAQPDASGGQPSWETFDHLSLVTAKSLESVTVDQDSITWILLQATSHSGSKEWLGDVTYVQRLETQRGLPPSSTAGAAVGDTYSSEYSAIYAYYVMSGLTTS